MLKARGKATKFPSFYPINSARIPPNDESPFTTLDILTALMISVVLSELVQHLHMSSLGQVVIFCHITGSRKRGFTENLSQLALLRRRLFSIPSHKVQKQGVH